MLLTYFDMLCIYKMWYVTFPLRMFWLKIILTRFSWFHFVVPEVQVGCFVKKFSKFTTINVSPFEARRADFWLFLARERIKEMFFLYQLKFVQPEAGKRHAHKCWQIVCLIELTLPSAYCKQNWIAERNLVNRLAILARVFGEHFVF